MKKLENINFRISTVREEISKYTNDKLRKVLIELSILYTYDQPSKAKLSSDLHFLFTLANTLLNTWADRYNEIKRLLDLEVIDRFKDRRL